MGSRALVAILFFSAWTVVAEDTWPAASTSTTDPGVGAAEASESGAGNCVEFILQLDLIGKNKSFVKLLSLVEEG